jgi:hypothetical protein
MTELFKALSGSLGRFVYAWLVPSLVTGAVFLLLVLPTMGAEPAISADLSGLGFAAIFALAVLTISVVFAYLAVPIYRFLEGYTLPRQLARRLRRRQLQEWHRLHRLQQFHSSRGNPLGEVRERLQAYPEDPESLLPTRLGNALRSMERYGGRRFGLDSQTVWYELQSVSPENLRRDAGDARATVDFFVSSVAHLSFLSIVSATAAVAARSITAFLVALVSALLVPAAYRGAVHNVAEWRSTVQALVNVGRVKLAPALGLELPPTFLEEQEMWRSWTGLVTYGSHDSYLRVLDRRRSTPAPPVPKADAPAAVASPPADDSPSG